MACHWSLQLNNSFYFSKSSGSKCKRRIKADAPNFSKFNGMEHGVSFFSKNSISLGFVFARYTSRYISLKVLSSMSSSASTGEINDVNEAVVSRPDDKNMELTRINCLVWVLHESATSFSQAVESLELAGSGPELAMAWNGKDVHIWHKRLAYQVAVYALLKTAIEVEILLSHDRHNPSPVKEMSSFTPKINLLGEYIENQLNMKHPELVQWFKVVELPHIAGFFAPSLKQWSVEYAGRLVQIVWPLWGFLHIWEERLDYSCQEWALRILMSLFWTSSVIWSVAAFLFTLNLLLCQHINVSWSRSAQQPLDAELLAFLLRSQSLLTICLEDYWAVYDRSCEPLKIVEAGASDHMLPVGTKGNENLYVTLEAQQRPAELILKGCLTTKSLQSINLRKASCSAQREAITHVEASSTTATRPNLPHESLLRKYSVKLVSTSSDLWMGTQLLVVDISCALKLLLKQFHGHEVTIRERKKLKRTLNDIITLIPVTILMLLPVSAVGHAAILAAIKKYMPFLIPSSYSAERLEVVKQLDRTKKMEVQSWINLEDPSSRIP
ncbi:uncharacterized protein LOC18094774 isoform X8 [Populus trichocarpa]|nr:uncharacterized protein LOC18094774 isoform X8 [Populus trichocarpa]